jgi:hypothetical protein
MSAPTPDAARFSTDIELSPIRPSSSSRPDSSQNPTSKSSIYDLNSPDTVPPTPAGSIHGLTSSSDPLNSQSLLPVDSGKDAWLFLVGSTIVEIMVWGIPYSIGVLHLYWTTSLFPGYGASTITLAATMQAGFGYIFTAVFGP